MKLFPTLFTITLILLLIAAFGFQKKLDECNVIETSRDSTATALKKTSHELDSLKKFHSENCVQGLSERIPDDHVIVSRQELEILRSRPPYPSPRPAPPMKIPVLPYEDYQYQKLYDNRVYKIVPIDSTQQK